MGWVVMKYNEGPNLGTIRQFSPNLPGRVSPAFVALVFFGRKVAVVDKIVGTLDKAQNALIRWAAILLRIGNVTNAPASEFDAVPRRAVRMV